MDGGVLEGSGEFEKKVRVSKSTLKVIMGRYMHVYTLISAYIGLRIRDLGTW